MKASWELILYADMLPIDLLCCVSNVKFGSKSLRLARSKLWADVCCTFSIEFLLALCELVICSEHPQRWMQSTSFSIVISSRSVLNSADSVSVCLSFSFAIRSCFGDENSYLLET